MRQIYLTLVLLLAATSSVSAICVGIDPDQPDYEACEYTHVPFETFAYNGRLNATWGPELQIIEAHVLADWEVVATYVPGQPIAVPIDPTRTRYDFVGEFEIVDTGERFNGITPIWCVNAPNLPAPVEGCFGGGVTPLDCSITESNTCSDGTKTSVTCSGDSGTCSSGTTGDGGSQCSASKTTTSSNGSGTETTTTESISKKQSCPKTES